MMKNLNLTNGLFFSQRVLIELTLVGFTREQAYTHWCKNTPCIHGIAAHRFMKILRMITKISTKSFLLIN